MERKPSTFRKEILEAEMSYGEMKLHSIHRYDAVLKQVG